MPILFSVAIVAAVASLWRHLDSFTDGSMFVVLIALFPAAVFTLWRIFHYLAYWFVYLTNADINPRRIAREPVFEYLLPAAFAAVVLAVIVTFFTRRRADGGF